MTNSDINGRHGMRKGSDAEQLSDAARSYKMKADQGDAKAQFNYGLCLDNGEGVPRNLSEAARYYKMSADQGHADAQFNYGMCLKHGEGVPRDLSEAARYYKMSADQGDAGAQLNYGFCLEHGEGVARNLSEAARYYKMSADQGNAKAQFNYGVCLEHGEGVARDLSEAARYYKMSADQGNAKAQFNYGVCLKHGEGVRRNLSEAARYYKMSADQGHADAQFNYGFCLKHGEGVPRDLSEAARYYKMSADQGDAGAQLNYGFCLEHGEGVARNLSEAARYYKMSADQGNSKAQLNYGFCLEHGEGVARNLSEAARYYKMSADQGNSKAAEQLKSLLSVDYVKKEVKPLSEWIVDMGTLEKFESDLVSGGSGTVQMFKRKSDGKVIVGKFLSVDDSGDNEIKFRRELSSLFGLDHPCIVRFAGYTLPCPSTDRRFLLFTEYVSGGSLSRVIDESGRFPWFNSTVRSIVIVGIVLGMKYVHSRGLFHRDLKPSNVLLDEEHHPLLCDFGSSRAFSDDVTMTGLPHVTLYYAAPELCDEEVSYNEKIDVYSFGISLYEIVTGKLALRHLNQMQVTAFIVRGKRPKIPESVLPFTRTLIERCWSQEPSQRPSFEEIYDYLKNGDFRLFDDVNCLAVRSYGRSLCDWEKAYAK